MAILVSDNSTKRPSWIFFDADKNELKEIGTERTIARLNIGDAEWSVFVSDFPKNTKFGVALDGAIFDSFESLGQSIECVEKCACDNENALNELHQLHRDQNNTKRREENTMKKDENVCKEIRVTPSDIGEENFAKLEEVIQQMKKEQQKWIEQNYPSRDHLAERCAIYSAMQEFWSRFTAEEPSASDIDTAEAILKAMGVK